MASKERNKLVKLSRNTTRWRILRRNNQPANIDSPRGELPADGPRFARAIVADAPVILMTRTKAARAIKADRYQRPCGLRLIRHINT